MQGLLQESQALTDLSTFEQRWHSRFVTGNRLSEDFQGCATVPEAQKRVGQTYESLSVSRIDADRSAKVPDSLVEDLLLIVKLTPDHQGLAELREFLQTPGNVSDCHHCILQGHRAHREGDVQILVVQGVFLQDQQEIGQGMLVVVQMHVTDSTGVQGF